MRIISDSGFAAASVEVEGLAQWMWSVFGRSSARVLYGQDGLSGGFSLSEEPREVQSVEIHDGTTIEFHFVTNSDVTEAPPKVTIEKQILLWIFPIEPVSDSDYFWRVARKIANLLSFITCEYLEITSIIAYEEDFRQDPSLLSTRTSQTIVSEDLPATTKITFVKMYSEYRLIEARFDDIITKWFELYQNCEYGLDLYFSNSIERSNKYLSTRFVVAVMALEALYHGRGGTEKKLNRIIGGMMRQFGEHFGDTEEVNARASRVVAIRKVVVHGSGETRRVVDGSKEMVDIMLNVEALFEMTVLSDLVFDVDELVKRHQGLARRIRLPRGFP